MSAVESNAQPYNGARRQPRHHQNGSNNGLPPVPTAGHFLIPEAQGTFTFSAEPSAYDGSLTGAPSANTPAPDSVFTPNVGSSLDSSMQHDMTSYSYPPLNYMQGQFNGLSPASFYDNAQGISPSHSTEHLSPGSSFLSDPHYQDISAYASPNGQNFNQTFSNINLSDNAPISNFPAYDALDMTHLTSSSLNTYNAQHTILPSNLALDPHQQLLSPSATNYSSPAMGDDVSALPSTTYTSLYHTSTPPNQSTHILKATPIQQTQSPALTNSPAFSNGANLQPLSRHLTSPIVRVEQYSREDSPTRSDNSRPVSKKSHCSRRSGNHLSPYKHDESDVEEPDTERMHVQPVIQSQNRNVDGSWLPAGSSSQAGLSPEDRHALGDAWVPSIDEISEQRSKDEKKLEVQQWLTKSEIGSEDCDVVSLSDSNTFLKPISGRRRAKSTNDAHRRDLAGNLGLGVRTNFAYVDDSGIPGPGVYVDERSDYDGYDDDDDSQPEPESPPAAVVVQDSHAENPYFPVQRESVSILGTVVRPWVDSPSQSANSNTRYQPETSNAAMMRFRIRAKDVESASLAATVGSRRLSEPDLASLKAAPGIARLVEPDPKKQKDRQRRPSFLENILPKRAPSNLLKRKTSVPVQSTPDLASDKTKEVILEKPKRIGSWGRPKSPRVDTNLSNSSKDGGPLSPGGLTPTTGPWYQGAKNAIRRSRSRSELGKSPGLAELMTQHGGPPMPMLASPLADTEAAKPFAQPSPAGDDDDDEPDAITMDLKVRTDPVIPTYDGFRMHARQLNPRLADFMVERITQEQMRRYKRLLEFRVKHLKAIKNGSCASGEFCTALGGEPKQLAPKAGAKDTDAPFIGFQITAPGTSDDDGDLPTEGTVISAQFPSGVPLPPVKRLPAEFECPLCFKVKKFYKPSDWTKHVHEDVQPFTCTFPNCGEPKSFKRKADWVRHENERHRQLENWTCQIADCTHTCYRKDNFVQHLVREHKIAEPKQRTGRSGNKDGAMGSENDIWGIVERCRQDTLKQPKDEPCRFCGNICTSWKKLTVHLAKHMEQISMPILPLVEQKLLNADSIISPIVEVPDSRMLSATPNRSPINQRPRGASTTGLAPGIDPYSPLPTGPGQETQAAVMHTYPPPQMVPYKGSQLAAPNGYPNNLPDTTQNYASQTYPGLQEPPKIRTNYANGLQIPNPQFHPGSGRSSPNPYGMSPASVMQPQVVYTDSPVDTTSFNYVAQEPQHMSGDLSAMGYTTNNSMQFQPQGTFHAMSYLAAQHNFQQYQGQ